MQTNLSDVVSIAPILIALVFTCWALDIDGDIGQDAAAALSKKVFGTCSKPNLPPTARVRHHPTEKVRFAENETIYIVCEQGQFPHHEQTRRCHHGEWQGAQTRCGKSIQSKVTSLKAFKCDDSRKAILSLDLNQTDDAPYALPINLFHFSRIHPDINLSVTESNCYNWIIKFDKMLELAFLLIDFNTIHMPNMNDTPIIEVNVPHRECALQKVKKDKMDNDEIYGYYLFCDLKVEIGNATIESFNTDHITVKVKTEKNRSVGLEAVFAGETYKKKVQKKMVPDCGRLEIKRTGVLEQMELRFAQVMCNDSFIDVSGIIKHKYSCDSNGLWQGSWPDCQPKKTCNKADIIDNLPSSIVIERIGNVYYTNQTEWHAIEQSWVRYECSSGSAVMVGKNDRLCVEGKWSNKIPHCSQVQDVQSGSLISIIAVILIALIVTFSLIVYLSIKSHTKKIKRRLESTKTEIEATALRQYSQDNYSEICLDTIYEDCKENAAIYEMPDVMRYDRAPQIVNESEYLSIIESAPSAQSNPFIAATGHEYST